MTRSGRRVPLPTYEGTTTKVTIRVLLLLALALQLDFEVIEGPGSVLLFVSTTDNGTGDSILRTE